MNDPLRKMYDQGLLLVVESEGRYYSPLKILLENIGFDWDEEKAKIQSNPLFAKGLKELNVYDGDETHKVLGIETPHLFAWVMHCHPDDYNDEVKSKLTVVQHASLDTLCMLCRDKADIPRPEFEQC